MSNEKLVARKAETEQMLQRLLEQQNQLLQQQQVVSQQLSATQNAIIATQASLSTLRLAVGEEPLPGSLPDPLLSPLTALKEVKSAK